MGDRDDIKSQKVAFSIVDFTTDSEYWSKLAMLAMINSWSLLYDRYYYGL